MSMEVINSLSTYGDKDASPVQVNSHPIDNKLVEVRIGSEKRIVKAADLINAVNNAINIERF